MITKITITAASATNQLVDIYSGQKGIAIYDATGPIIQTIIADVLAAQPDLATALAAIE
jgi:hypothetical protein